MAMVMLALACAPSAEPHEAAEPSQSKSIKPAIRHLSPAADSVGGLPARFEWTPVEGADRYAINVYNDVDRLLWQREDIGTAFVDRPEELDLDAGTYFWRIYAIHENKQLADSGWSAFVVRR